MYSIQTICAIVSGRFQQQTIDTTIAHLVYDSRTIVFGESSLFFALKASHRNGLHFVADAHKKGVRNFIVGEPADAGLLPESNIILVPDVLAALQTIAAYHRSHFTIPVVGITGSNGKTIVKEWLYQLLQEDYTIVRSPKSFNSQIGVPLSVWQITEQHTLALFEAGISEPGEMNRLHPIIQPTIGLFTNIGEAHSEHFDSIEQKIAEKWKLFNGAETVVYCTDIKQIDEFVTTFYSVDNNNKRALPKLFSWGKATHATVQIINTKKMEHTTHVTIVYHSEEYALVIPFIDVASVQNAITCCCIMLLLQYDVNVINERLAKLHPIDMRLQLKSGINDCTIINDSYSADLTSLHIALQFLVQQTAQQFYTAILSDFIESGKADDELYRHIAKALVKHKVQRVIGIGDKITHFLPQYLPGGISFQGFTHTDDFVKSFRSSLFNEETILIKGARKFSFERIAQLFEQQVHLTRLSINLNAIAHNLREYRRLLQPQTKIMAMVKAFAYGSGGAEIASVLQYHKADYLGVAYTDEGVDLRQAGITLPIMVMNTDETAFALLIEHNLQPVIYSWEVLYQLENYLTSQGLQYYPVHIEVETGMNRLGFAVSEIEKLANHLHQSTLLKVESLFTHLAASDDAAQDAFTTQQAALFNIAAQEMQSKLSYSFLKHIANSAAIIRHPHLQMDMVRLGIGLYGVEIATVQLDLQPAATLQSTIAQLKQLKAGETVSYNRQGVVKEDSVIATVRIGYADGYTRKFSNGTGKMWVNGKLAPVIGSVCMDMTMVNVTGIADVKEGNEVIIFGEPLPIEQVATWIDTIPYEIMTSVSQRVKRIYFQE